MIKETTQLQGFPKMKLPKLKGEVEIRLHNPTTGKTEVHTAMINEIGLVEACESFEHTVE
jgi:hypothetical protein